MSSSNPAQTTRRAPRRDAARNREALIAAARTAFQGTGDAASLDGIARAAGVGIGTLYRHFPTRDDLVAAVYAAELDAVLSAADELLTRPPADAAFRAWTDEYARFVAAKRGLAESMRAGALAETAVAAHTRDRVTGVIARFLEAGRAEGVLRSGLEADDVTTLLVGVLLSARNGDPSRIPRLLDLVFDGLRA